ncbi:major facilitator superfamily domain-containing protein [Kockovaella imperatae]|uniref:Major facilitator superfamily domain-containing protein n=1 Tax=Kockovaella imperatae TaxID=4999 RepID=A0A1Y1UEL8_9TREE|nr:major facilitator superfamily domain-containing protein [Kockovaella imperatae]ORX36511.1 major facilitator superfamily domain-containing protein [Kockovaella imperatae]
MPFRRDEPEIDDVKDSQPPSPELLPTQRTKEVISLRTKISAVFTVVFSGIALLSDGYNASIVGYLNLLFKPLYPDAFTHEMKTRISNSFFIGEIVGQLGFGMAIDRVGRKAGILLTTSCLIMGIILSAAAHGKTNEGLLWMMLIGRGLAGVGAGGEYPVAGTASIEAADETSHVRTRRGFLIASVGCGAIDLGFVIGGIVPIIILLAYGYTTHSTGVHGFVGTWRITMALGLVPVLSVFYFRIKMLNSTAYRKNAMKGKRISLKILMLAFRRYWRRIIGTCACWFLYDFCSYPFGIFSSTIVGQLNPDNTILQNIGWGTLINAFLPFGCLVGGVLLDKIGRRNTQALGFAAQGVIGMILGGVLSKIQNNTAAFVIVYGESSLNFQPNNILIIYEGIFLAVAEAGPGVATILIGGEVYPTALRGHFLGFSAAWGKAGAAIGTQVFTPIQNAFSDDFRGQQAVFLIGSAVSIVGAIITYICIPEMGTGQYLEDEDAAWRAYLESHGVSTNEFGEAVEASASGQMIREIEDKQ